MKNKFLAKFDSTCKRMPITVLLVYGILIAALLWYIFHPMSANDCEKGCPYTGAEFEQFRNIDTIITSAVLAIPFVISLISFGIVRKWNKTNSMLAQLGGVLVVIAFIKFGLFSEKSSYWGHQGNLLMSGAFLLSFAPFLGKKMTNAFWHYNAIWAALVLALMVVGWTSPSSMMVLILLIVIAPVIFMTRGFLLAIPKDFQKLENLKSYPEGLKNLSKYLFIPAYIIANVYSLKWLKSMDYSLVDDDLIMISIFGLLTFFVSYPFTKDKVIKYFQKYFWIVSIPLIAVYIKVILLSYERNGTEYLDYLVVALPVVLILLAPYLSFSKNIKAIPIAIFLVYMAKFFVYSF